MEGETNTFSGILQIKMRFTVETSLAIGNIVNKTLLFYNDWQINIYEVMFSDRHVKKDLYALKLCKNTKTNLPFQQRQPCL